MCVVRMDICWVMSWALTVLLCNILDVPDQNCLKGHGRCCCCSRFVKRTWQCFLKGQNKELHFHQIPCWVMWSCHVGSCDHVIQGLTIKNITDKETTECCRFLVLNLLPTWLLAYCTVRNRILGFSRFQVEDLHASNKLLQMDKLQSEFHLLFLP